MAFYDGFKLFKITRMKKLLIFFLPAILLGCDSPAYRNPLDVAFGDPFVLHAADGKFYMYGTSGDIKGFRVCVSDDLVTWQKGDVVYDGNASAWGTDCFWAPEVYERDGGITCFSALTGGITRTATSKRSASGWRSPIRRRDPFPTCTTVRCSIPAIR